MTPKEFYARRDRLREALTAAKLPASTKLVGLTMIDHINREIFTASDNGLMLCWLSVSGLAAATDLSERSVTRARAALIDHKIVVRVTSKSLGGREPAKYAFNTGWIAAVANDAAANENARVAVEAEAALAAANHPDRGAKRGAGDGAPDPNRGAPRLGALGAPGPAPKPLNKPMCAHERTRACAGDPKNRLRRALSPAEFDAWIAGADIAVIDDTAMIEVPTRHVADWINQRLADRVRAALGVEHLDIDVAAPPLRQETRCYQELH